MDMDSMVHFIFDWLLKQLFCALHFQFCVYQLIISNSNTSMPNTLIRQILSD